jgi:hypothetical protein
VGSDREGDDGVLDGCDMARAGGLVWGQHHEAYDDDDEAGESANQLCPAVGVPLTEHPRYKARWQPASRLSCSAAEERLQTTIEGTLHHPAHACHHPIWVKVEVAREDHATPSLRRSRTAACVG